MPRTPFTAPLVLGGLAAATAGACAGPAPELTFTSHLRTRMNEPGMFERRLDVEPDFQVTVESRRSYGRVLFTGSLTTPGRDWLAAATDEVERAWDPPYDCIDCTQFDSYRFVADDGTPAAVRTYPGIPPEDFPTLSMFVEQVFFELSSCQGGPHTTFCVRIDLPE